MYQKGFHGLNAMKKENVPLCRWGFQWYTRKLSALPEEMRTWNIGNPSEYGDWTKYHPWRAESHSTGWRARSPTAGGARGAAAL